MLRELAPKHPGDRNCSEVLSRSFLGANWGNLGHPLTNPLPMPCSGSNQPETPRLLEMQKPHPGLPSRVSAHMIYYITSQISKITFYTWVFYFHCKESLTSESKLIRGVSKSSPMDKQGLTFYVREISHLHWLLHRVSCLQHRAMGPRKEQRDWKHARY